MYLGNLGNQSLNSLNSLNSLILNYFLLFNQILLYSQVVDDKVLSLEGIFTHIERQQVVNRVILCESHLIQTHILADKLLELISRNLTQTFESRNLGTCTASLDGSNSLLLK